MLQSVDIYCKLLTEPGIIDMKVGVVFAKFKIIDIKLSKRKQQNWLTRYITFTNLTVILTQVLQ